MIELIEKNGIKVCSARNLHELLEVSSQFSTWISRGIENAWLIENVDYFITKNVKNVDNQYYAGRNTNDYHLTKDAALSIIVMSRVKKAKAIRTEIVKAFEQKQTGLLLNADQVAALTDVVKAMTLVSIQKQVENKHFNLFNKPKEWWKYRADLLGYSPESLKTALQQINKAYKSQKQALIHIDPSEIIRTGVIDLLIALGRDKEYALNVAEFAKIIAQKTGFCYKIWDDTKPNPLGLNLPEIIERQKLNPLKT